MKFFDSSASKYAHYKPDILKDNLNQVQIVLIDKGSMLGGEKSGDYDSRDYSSMQAKRSEGSHNKEPLVTKVAAYTTTTAINLSSQIAISDVINESFDVLGNVGAFAFNKADVVDKAVGGFFSKAIGSKVPPLVPKLSYERLTAYKGASVVSHSVDLLFVYRKDFKLDVIAPIKTLTDWYLPNRLNSSIGDSFAKASDMLQPLAGDSKIVEGLKVIGKAITDVSADIFKNCYFLEVPVGALNPTRIYIGPSGDNNKTGIKPVYCGDWLVNNFSLKTTDFVVYDSDSKCLRPEVVQVSLGLMSWRVTDNKSFNIFSP